MVFWVCKQIESAVMRSKNVANEQKTETLALGLGREKRSEEILRYSRRDAMTIVGDGERSWRGDFKGDNSLCRIPADAPARPLVACKARTRSLSDTLHSILDDVDEHLLEQDGVEPHGCGFVGEAEADAYALHGAEALQERPASLHLLAQVAELQLRLRYLHHQTKR